MERSAIFLDRDGTLNEDPGYLSNVEGLKLLPDVGEALRLADKNGFVCVVISNQSGINRGLIEPSQLQAIHQRMNDLLQQEFQVEIGSFYFCPHHPEEGCACRKPKPQLILDAAKDLSIDLESSYMVGDRQSDLLAGRAASLGGVALVRTGNGRETEKNIKFEEANFVGDSLLDVVQWILSQR